MDAWIEFARGPLFRIALTVLVLGLAYRFVVALAQVLTAWRRAGDSHLPWGTIVAKTLGWLVPVRLFSQRPVYSLASVVFHVGMIVVPLFLAGHVLLLRGFLPAWWPMLSATWADVLTIAAIAGIAMMILGRAAVQAVRALTKPGDALILILLLLTFVFGFLAGHPGLSPFPARSMLLLHILSGNLVLVLVPVTKIAHCVLYPLMQLVFVLGWHYPASSGRDVAAALAKENEPI